MRADVEKKHAAVGDKEKLDAVFLIYPKRPRASILAMQFMRAQAEIVWVETKQPLLFFCRCLNDFRERAIVLIELRSGVNTLDRHARVLLI